MVEITIAVPEMLAEQLAAVRDHLPEVLIRGLHEAAPPANEVYRYVLAFLATSPAPEDILNFALTSAMQARASALLDIQRAGQLTPMDMAELDEYTHIDNLLSVLKAGALRRV
ncbi:MAG: hypothetical protein FJZ47_21300, partial [Candidatus Tectomicrobia bacterium]|nr:hypothetical protein [Candidatus Tectomicrobia bacterium]